MLQIYNTFMKRLSILLVNDTAEKGEMVLTNSK